MTKTGTDAIQAVADEPHFVEAHWRSTYRHTIEENMSAFLAGLSQGRLVAGRCSHCGKVSVPARTRCGFCRRRIAALTDVGPAGTVRAVSVIAVPMAGLSDPPGAIACVQPDGADTGLLARLFGVEATPPAGLVELIGRTCRLRDCTAPTGTWDDLSFEIMEMDR